MKSSLDRQLITQSEARPISSEFADEQEVGHPIELAIVIPTYDECENVRAVVTALESALVGIDWEVIFVDDHSPDGTADRVRELASRDRRIRVLERIGGRGLSSACIEGMLATPARYIAVMDADLQHDERILPQMLACIKSSDVDIVVGSRKAAGGSMGQLAHNRVRLSNLGSRVSRLICHCEISDPMSGFFVVDRNYFRAVADRLSGRGFKILVDLLASSERPVRIVEVPYYFRNRQRGTSKLNVNVELEYLFLLVDKLVGSLVPTRFVIFLIVGLLGLFVHLGVLAVLYRGLGLSFVTSQAAATLVAMTSNFLINNVVTFRDRALRGMRVLLGLLTFYAACSIGALINVSFADFLRRSLVPWYAAGLIGTAIGSVWNYGVNTVITWRRGRALA